MCLEILDVFLHSWRDVYVLDLLQPPRFVLLGEAVMPPVETLVGGVIRLSLPLHMRGRTTPVNADSIEYWENVVRWSRGNQGSGWPSQSRGDHVNSPLKNSAIL